MGGEEIGKHAFLAPGCIVVMDLDDFKQVTERMGWHPYKPNIITGRLTVLVESLLTKHNGVSIYGLDYQRGTEEAVIEFPFKDCSSIKEELEIIRKEVNDLGFSITIVCVNGIVLGKPSSSRKGAYHGSPWRRRASTLLRRAKRRGGNTIYCE